MKKKHYIIFALVCLILVIIFITYIFITTDNFALKVDTFLDNISYFIGYNFGYIIAIIFFIPLIIDGIK